MSDYISFEIQAEIMNRLPVKSLIQFRSVSKPWKAFIESRQFISDYYLLHNTRQQYHHLLIKYAYTLNSEEKYVSLVDDDTFPLHKHSITLPDSVKLFRNPNITTSQGLFCLHNFYGKPSINGTYSAIIWNPLITKSVDIEIPNVLDWPYATVVGFGVCPKTVDIKLVRITFACYVEDPDVIISVPWQVNVFTLSSGVWRSPLCSNLPRNSIELTPNQVDLDGVIYWLGYDTVMVDGEIKVFNLIMSFDMINEDFTEVFLPDSLANCSYTHLGISKLRESLAVFKYISEIEKQVCEVSIMEHSEPNSFTMLFTINMTDTSINRVLGFKTNAELVIITKKNEFDGLQGALFVYEPYSENISDINYLCGNEFSFFASSYPETLLLLDH